MGAASNPQKRRLYKAIAAGLAVLLLFLGFIAGFFTARQMGARDLTRCYSSVQQQVAALSRSTDNNSSALRELPPPGSAEAQQARKQPGALDPFEAELYTLYSDADTITEESTAGFLQQLGQHLAANAASFNLQGSGRNMTQTLEEFEGVAADILNYFRERNSQALLSLLRQYSQQGTFTLADVDPDMLQQEVAQILDVNQLGKYYARISQRGGSSDTTRPTISSQSTPQVQVEAGTRRGSSANNTNNRRLQATPRQRSPARHLLAPAPAPAAPAAAAAPAPAAAAAPAPAPAAAAAAAPVPPARQQPGSRAAAPIPGVPKAAAAAAAQAKVPAPVSPLTALQEMLCGIKDQSPTGLQGMLLPSGRNGTGSGRGKPIVCPPSSGPAVSRYNQTQSRFKPVRIPVVFHCMRFSRPNDKKIHPPMWDAQEAGANLVKVANALYKQTLIQFALKEVRYDTEKYPYLLKPTMADWQTCTGNPTEEQGSFPCLQETAALPEVAPLVKQHVLNVFVGGSQFRPYCQGPDDETGCRGLYSGYAGSTGPWFAMPSPTWSEDALTENWVFMTWDEFSPAVSNSEKAWNRGGITFAHEAGHYLGLMHTHQGGCDSEDGGDGLTAADAVPDTPLNLDIASYANGRMMFSLNSWCTEFRRGKQPDPTALLQFNSCNTPSGVDNVFNLLSYLPDSCCMLLTTNQVARMQWAIARFRPKMMAKYAIK